MGRAYSNEDMDDSDDIGMESAEEYISSFDAAEMASSREDAAVARSVTSRCRIRDQINSDIDAYLASGGAIHPADEYKRSDPSGGSHGHHHGSGLH